MLPVIVLALTTTAHAQDCDVKALKKEIAEASPVALPAVYSKLADCNPAEAKKLTAKTFERILAGDDGHAAALKAIELGLEADVRTWLAGLEPDQRSRAIAWFGDRCKDSEVVQGFFLSTHAEKGLEFWEDRWHRGLTECRVEPVQKLLSEALTDKELAKNRRTLFQVLEVYARNLRGEAIPTLIALAGETTDPEELTYLVNAFADTTGMGSVQGMDQPTAVKAAAAIVPLGAKLPARAIEQARVTLKSLGDEESSDRFAQYRWPELKNEDGNYRYAVAVRETATCKNTKTKGVLHVAAFTEAGRQWPDQLAVQILEKLKFEWEMDLATACKGKGEFVVDMTEVPIGSDEDVQRWIEERVISWNKGAADFDKASVVRHETFEY